MLHSQLVETFTITADLITWNIKDVYTDVGLSFLDILVFALYVAIIIGVVSGYPGIKKGYRKARKIIFWQASHYLGGR